MVQWNSRNQGKLRNALLNVYTKNEIRILVRDTFEDGDDFLRRIAGDSDTEWVSDLLEKAAKDGRRVVDLYVEFCRRYPRHTVLEKLQADLGDRLLDTQKHANLSTKRTIPAGEVGVAKPSKAPLGFAGEAPRTAHLVIGVFHQGTDDKTVMVHPQICYWDAEQQSVRRLAPQAFPPLDIQNDSEVLLREFPTFLDGLMGIVEDEEFLDQFLPAAEDDHDDWTIIIHLFLPIEFLHFPLSKWCLQDLLEDYTVVLGCSDRFTKSSGNRQKKNPSRLRNKLKKGWRKLQETSATPEKGHNLQNAAWLTSAAECSTLVFENYSGFQCYGEFLKSGVAYIQNWQRIIEAGMPIALWMCSAQSPCPQAGAIFQQLINGTCVELMEKILNTRRQQFLNQEACVGLFYETPDYTPEIVSTAPRIAPPQPASPVSKP
ncbi:MAG: effector-associated domain EAD1-containing protein [Cyanobacteria bacterium P01_G01_bin.54]